MDRVKLGVVTGGGDIPPLDGKGVAKRVSSRVNRAGVMASMGVGPGVISPNFIGAPNKVEAREPRLNIGVVEGKEKGMGNRAAVSGVIMENGLALMPGLGVKLDKSSGGFLAMTMKSLS